MSPSRATKEDPIDLDGSEAEDEDKPALTPEQAKIVQQLQTEFQSTNERELIDTLRYVDFDLKKGREEVQRKSVAHLREIARGHETDDYWQALYATGFDVFKAYKKLTQTQPEKETGDLETLQEMFAEQYTAEDLRLLYLHLRSSVRDVASILTDPDSFFVEFYDEEGRRRVTVHEIKQGSSPEADPAERIRERQEALERLIADTGRSSQDCGAALKKACDNWDLAKDMLQHDKVLGSTDWDLNSNDSDDEDLDLGDEDSDSESGDEGESDTEESSSEEDTSPEPSKNKSKKQAGCKPNGGSADPKSDNSDDSESDGENNQAGKSTNLPSAKRGLPSADKPNAKRQRRELNGNDDKTWAEKNYSKSDGLSLVFKDGAYPHKIPVEHLNRIPFFVDYFKTHGDDGENHVITVPTINCKGFELLLQFAMTKQLNLDLHPRTYPAPEHKIDGYISFLDTALLLGLWITNRDLEILVEKLKNVLVTDRYALKGRHIRFAYDYHKETSPKENALSQKQGQDAVRGNFLLPLQDLFVQSATKCFIEYRNDPYALPLAKPPPVYDSDEEGVDTARTDAFGTGFRFDRELERILLFKYNLLESFDKAWRGREWQSSKSNTTARRYFLDPLTFDRFECD